MIPRRGSRSLASGLCALAVAGASALSGCAGSARHVPAAELLAKAKQTADGASALHFSITGKNVSLSGLNLVSGAGDLARPDSMAGSFRVSDHGVTVEVKVASVGGVFEAQLPFSDHYQKADPASLGLSDPAQLLDPDSGLTKLLTLAVSPRTGADIRVGGELLETVTYDVPGSDVPVLPDLKPSAPVTMTVAINPSNFQLRQVTLLGPFTSAKSNSTYVVTLTNYNEHVTITLPPAS